MKSKKTLIIINVLLLLVGVSLLLVSGCSSIQMYNMWHDPTYNAGPLNKVLVVAMRKDSLNRRMWEDAFVSAMMEQRAKTTFVSSYQLFPDQLPDTLTIRERVRQEGFDGILIISRITLDTLQKYVPGYTTYEPAYYEPWWGFYDTYWQAVYHPEHTETEKEVTVRTDLLLVQENGKMVWSVTSRAIDPASPVQFRNSVAELATNDLKKQDLIH
ncbi:MAG TPA: hypothetical protein VMT04_01740 [Terriglobales bacterium]|nr:hypothetical protein [Terriglobales bacterium]